MKESIFDALGIATAAPFPLGKKLKPRAMAPRQVMHCVYLGGQIIAANKPLFCQSCDKALIPEYESALASPTVMVAKILDRRRGKIVPIIEANGRHGWSCHYCGRRAVEKREAGNGGGQRMTQAATGEAML